MVRRISKSEIADALEQWHVGSLILDDIAELLTF